MLSLSVFAEPTLFGDHETREPQFAPRQRRVDAARDEIRSEVREAINVLNKEKDVQIAATPPDRLRVTAREGTHARAMLELASEEGRMLRLGNSSFTVHRSIRENLVTWRAAFERARAERRTIRVKPFEEEMLRQIRADELGELVIMLRRFGPGVIANTEDLQMRINAELDRRDGPAIAGRIGPRLYVDERPAPRAPVQPRGEAFVGRRVNSSVPPAPTPRPTIVAAPPARGLWGKFKGLFGY